MIRELQSKLRHLTRHRKFDMSKLPPDLLKFQQLSQDFRVRSAVESIAGFKDRYRFGEDVYFRSYSWDNSWHRGTIVRVYEDHTYDIDTGDRIFSGIAGNCIHDRLAVGAKVVVSRQNHQEITNLLI